MSWLHSVLSIFTSVPNQQWHNWYPKRKRRRQQSCRHTIHSHTSQRNMRVNPHTNWNYRKNWNGNQNRNGTIAFHGTPSTDNAKSILKDGWLVGHGNAYGDGIYFASDLQTAKSYAGSNGLYLKCLLQTKRVCNWNNIQNQYDAWCRKKGVLSNNSAKTAFLIQHGYDCVRSGNIVVMLAPQYANPSAWKRKNRKIRILSIHRSRDDKKIRV